MHIIEQIELRFAENIGKSLGLIRQPF